MSLWTLDPIDPATIAIIEEEHGKFQMALGRLVLCWSDLESVLRSVLRNYAGVSREAGRALFSGTRARQAMDFVGSIAHNTNLDAARRSDLAEVFPVVAAINTMRDFLTHHVNGSLIDSDDDQPTLRKVSNADTAARAGKGQTFWIDSALVNQMCDDLTECCWRLIAHTENSADPFQQGVGPTGRPQPWLYKSPQPSSTRARQRIPPAS